MQDIFVLVFWWEHSVNNCEGYANGIYQLFIVNLFTADRLNVFPIFCRVINTPRFNLIINGSSIKIPEKEQEEITHKLVHRILLTFVMIWLQWIVWAESRIQLDWFCRAHLGKYSKAYLITTLRCISDETDCNSWRWNVNFTQSSRYIIAAKYMRRCAADLPSGKNLQSVSIVCKAFIRAHAVKREECEYSFFYLACNKNYNMKFAMLINHI